MKEYDQKIADEAHWLLNDARVPQNTRNCTPMNAPLPLTKAERFVIEHRTASAVLVLAFVGACVLVPKAVHGVIAMAEAAGARSRAEERAFHRRHDEWVRKHSGEVWSTCHRDQCTCDNICDDDHVNRFEACHAARPELLPNGTLVCKVP